MNRSAISTATRAASKRRAIGLPMLRAGASIEEVMAATGAERATVQSWTKLGKGYVPEAEPPRAPEIRVSFTQGGFSEDEPIG